MSTSSSYYDWRKKIIVSPTYVPITWSLIQPTHYTYNYIYHSPDFSLFFLQNNYINCKKKFENNLWWVMIDVLLVWHWEGMYSSSEVCCIVQGENPFCLAYLHLFVRVYEQHGKSCGEIVYKIIWNASKGLLKILRQFSIVMFLWVQEKVFFLVNII